VTRVLVTGGSSGLGAALVRAYAARGARVLNCDLNEPDDGAESFLRLDVRSDDDWAAARAWVEREWGGLDVLVNNAGVAGGGRIDVATMAEWEWITQINLFGVVRGTRAFVPTFKRQHSGQVVNVASLAGLASDFPLAAAWTAARSRRSADGPDEVHRGMVARLEIGKHR
jgi:NAD(P)-dependent dehydrogenase (short-subunit alcohol dehydrogenase family)